MIVAPEEIEFGAYLDKMMTGSRSISQETVRSTRKLWNLLQAYAGQFPEPSAAPFEGKMCLSWERDDHHLHIEIRPDQLFDWFYFNYDDGDSSRRDRLALSHIPKDLGERLHIFIDEVRS